MRGSKIVQVFIAALAMTACSTPNEDEDTGSESAEQNAGESALGSGGVCTKRNEDCTARRACCSGSVCAFGGEREGTWCQALEPAAWAGSCVTNRTGAKLQMSASARGRVCMTLGETIPATCHEVKNGYCLIGYRGECGDGEYFIAISSLVQVETELCR